MAENETAPEACPRCSTPVEDLLNEPALSWRGQTYHGLCAGHEALEALESHSASIRELCDACDILCVLHVQTRRRLRDAERAEQERHARIAAEVHSIVRPAYVPGLRVGAERPPREPKPCGAME